MMLFAGVDHQLANNIGPVEGDFSNVAEFPFGAEAGLELREGKLSLDEDGGEEVVEVMGNAAGERTDAFQFLEREGLLLGAAPFSDIQAGAGNMAGLFIQAEFEIAYDGAERAIGAGYLEFARVAVRAGNTCAQPPAHAIAIVANNEVLKLVVALDGGGVDTEDAEHLLRPGDALFVHTPAPVSHVSDAFGILQAIFVFADGFAVVDFVGDVLRDADSADELALIVADRIEDGADETNFCVGPHDAVFAADGRHAGVKGAVRIEEFVAVAGMNVTEKVFKAKQTLANTEDPIDLLRPGDGAGVRYGLPTRDFSDALRVLELSFT